MKRTPFADMLRDPKQYLMEDALFVYIATYTKPLHAFINGWSMGGVECWQPLPSPPPHSKP